MTERPGRFERWRAEHPLVFAAALFGAMLVAYHANGRPITQVDCLAAPYVAWSLARYGDLDVGRYPATAELARRGALVTRSDGSRVSRYPPGSALLAIPLLAPLAWWQDEAPRMSRMRRLGKLVAAAACAGAVVAFAFAALAVAPGGAVWATLLFAFGTSVWSTASQGLWTHGPALLGLCVALALALDPLPRSAGRRADRLALAVGLALGLAIWSRPTTVLFAAATPLALWAGGRRREAVWAGGAAAVATAGLLLFNHAVYGAGVSGGYGNETSRFDTPVWLGAAGLLVSPSRGLLVFSPALALLPFAGAALRSDPRPLSRGVLWAWAAAALATLLLYAKWHAWHGGYSFGTRLLCEVLPVAGLFFALAAQRLSAGARPGRWLLGMALALSLGIHAVGVFGHGNDWNARHPRSGHFSWRDGQIEAHARHLFGRLSGEGAAGS